MGVRLTWKESNIGEEGHRVYRSASPMDPENLPPPIATLGPNATEYQDDPLPTGVPYFYRVGAFTGAIERVSEEVSITPQVPAFRHALFKIWDSTLVDAPYNLFLYNQNLAAPIRSVEGPIIPWELRWLSGDNAGSSAGDEAVEYSTLDWPAKPPKKNGIDLQTRLLSTSESINWVLGGLDPGKTYNLEFLGSRTESGNRVLRMVVNGVAQQMSVYQNTGDTLKFENVAPNGSGEITITQTGGTSNSWSYLSAFYVVEN